MNNFHFDIPYVLVPNTFTWAIQLSNADIVSNGVGFGFGVTFYNPPTVGSSGNFAWEFSSGTWTQETDSAIFMNYGARVVASPVPEPATMLLLGSGLIGLAGYGRKKFFKK